MKTCRSIVYGHSHPLMVMNWRGQIKQNRKNHHSQGGSQTGITCSCWSNTASAEIGGVERSDKNAVKRDKKHFKKRECKNNPASYAPHRHVCIANTPELKIQMCMGFLILPHFPANINLKRVESVLGQSQCQSLLSNLSLLMQINSTLLMHY